MIEIKGPSSAEIKNFIKEKSVVDFFMINSKTIRGQILWHDENVFHINSEDGQVLTIFKRAVMYYSKAK